MIFGFDFQRDEVSFSFLLSHPTALSCICESTNDVKFIQQVMGHADFSTTMDIYTHITQENMQEKAKNISVNMKLM